MITINNINYVEHIIDSPIVKKEVVIKLESDIIKCNGIITYIRVKTRWYLTMPLLYCKFLIPENNVVLFTKYRSIH